MLLINVPVRILHQQLAAIRKFRTKRHHQRIWKGITGSTLLSQCSDNIGR